MITCSGCGLQSRDEFTWTGYGVEQYALSRWGEDLDGGYEDRFDLCPKCWEHLVTELNKIPRKTHV